jgi:lipopolysaccharide export system protein LptA
MLVTAQVLLLAAPAHALEADRDQPFKISAVSVEIDEKTGTALYRGNVVVKQGSVRIEADRLEVRMEKKRVGVVIATGKPVRMRGRLDDRPDELLANAERLVYRVALRELDLSGNAWIRQGTDEFHAHQIHYGLNDKRLSAVGKDAGDGRVRAIIHPKPKSENP